MNLELKFKDQLRTADERVTRPRLAIFRILIRHSPLSIAKLITKAKADQIDPVTVYRTLELLRRLNLVRELGVGRHRLFELGDIYNSHHHHFTCLECGRVTDFDSETIENDLDLIGERLGFDVESHQLEVNGVCADCKTKIISYT
jgi:Fe2+ or Zn2+ uptake regulation protein